MKDVKVELSRNIYEMISKHIDELGEDINYVLLTSNDNIIVKMINSENVFVLSIKESE